MYETSLIPSLFDPYHIVYQFTCRKACMEEPGINAMLLYIIGRVSHSQSLEVRTVTQQYTN